MCLRTWSSLPAAIWPRQVLVDFCDILTYTEYDQATGALGDASTTPKARVSYSAGYFDIGNRVVAGVEVGTNGGSSWTRPSSVPSRSDTVLVTSYGYAADAVQQVKLTGSPTGGTFTLTYSGQTTSTIAYNASAATVQSALQALSTIGSGNALVAGGAGGPWAVRFAGSLGGIVVATLTGSGAGLTGGTSPSVAISITSQGGDAGRAQDTTDPRGIVVKSDYDLLGRAVRQISAYANFAPGAASDVTAEYGYDGSGHTLTITADLPDGAHQTTQYVYGVTSSGGSDLASNDILAAVQYPDATTGNPSSSEQETYTVNALGETKTQTDRNGNVHTLTMDILGRPTADAVTTLGSGVDGSVRRIETAYNTQGLAYLFTSYDAASAGNIVNQVQDAFNGLGQLTIEYQSHSGAVNTSSTPKVQYAFSEMANGANHSRLTSMTYPNSRVITFNYGSGLDSSISRLSSISDGSTTLEEYSYLGAGSIVKRAHPEPGVDLTYDKLSSESTGDAGDQYTGLDRFGRIADQRWLDASTGVALDRFKYGHDLDSNRLYRENLIDATFSELYHANGASAGYDSLNRLADFARGTLSDTNSDNVPDTVASATRSQNWDQDALGNWNTVTTDGSGQTRTHNQQNEITSISGQTTPAFDANGNMTTDQTGKTLVYNAWNRLVQVKSGSTVLVAHQYDALNRRVVENAGTAKDLYYSTGWQILEEREGTLVRAHYVWSPVYVDAMIERDRDADSNGTLEERLYALADANWNVTAVVSTAGAVQERYIYDPYGAVGFRAPDWTSRGSSSFAWVILHQGGRFESTSGLYHFRNRDFSAVLGRWLANDPIGLADGANMYGYVGNSPTVGVDPSGLFVLQDHVTLTERAILAWARRHGIGAATFEYVRRIVVRNNLDQDVQHFNDLARHFTREYRRDDENAELNQGAALRRLLAGREWDTRYSEYVQSELSYLRALGAESCREQLEVVGRLTHSWQDFFAHAVRADQGGRTHRNTGRTRTGLLGSENSFWPGFSAFADPDRVVGDPDHRLGFIPASYASFISAEHPRTEEPLVRGGPEYQTRFAAAQQYTARRIDELLTFWDRNCGCAPVG